MAYVKVFEHKLLSLDAKTKLAVIAICGVQPRCNIDLLMIYRYAYMKSWRGRVLMTEPWHFSG